MYNEKRSTALVLLVVILLSALNVYLFKTSSLSLTGFATSEDEFRNLSWDFSKIAFILQWLLILLIIYFAYVRHIKRARAERITIDYDSIKGRKGRAGTDIDLLYGLIKEKKRLRLSTISIIFKITKENALEWARLLENHNLVTINYPAFSEPEIELFENEKEASKTEKETSKEEKKADEKKASEKSPDEKKASSGKNSKEKVRKKRKKHR